MELKDIQNHKRSQSAHSQRPQSAQFASSVTFHTWAGPELESGQTLSILRMPGHGLSKCCNISHLGMALVTYYRTQIRQDGCCMSTFRGGWVFRRGYVHPSCHGYPLAVTNTTKDYVWGVWGHISLHYYIILQYILYHYNSITIPL